MPTYEFRCPDGTLVERVFRMSEVPDSIPSPKGDGVAVRIISGGADLIFKGSGFYITDYGKDGKKDQRKAQNEGAKSEGKSTAGASSETKASGSEGKSDAPAKSATPAPAPDKPDKGGKKPGPSSPSSDAAA
jgi:predicted nucleic acid-binding Zn ribbon protein